MMQPGQLVRLDPGIAQVVLLLTPRAELGWTYTTWLDRVP